MVEARSYRIAVIPGDGIGNEVVPEGIRVLEAVGARFGIDYAWDHYDWSCQRFAKTGAMMPSDGPMTLAPGAGLPRSRKSAVGSTAGAKFRSNCAAMVFGRVD